MVSPKPVARNRKSNNVGAELGKKAEDRVKNWKAKNFDAKSAYSNFPLYNHPGLMALKDDLAGK